MGKDRTDSVEAGFQEVEGASASHDAGIEAILDDAKAAESSQGAEANRKDALQEAKDQALRAQAELENFRKRMLRDVEQQLRFASLPFAGDLLDVVDNLHRAIQAAKAKGDANEVPDASLVEGVQMVYQQLLQVLEKHQCFPIAAVGEPFDPNIHQAISQSPSNEVPAGNILLETSVGYRMYDRVIRPSLVIVSTGPA